MFWNTCLESSSEFERTATAGLLQCTRQVAGFEALGWNWHELPLEAFLKAFQPETTVLLLKFPIVSKDPSWKVGNFLLHRMVRAPLRAGARQEQREQLPCATETGMGQKRRYGSSVFLKTSQFCVWVLPGKGALGRLRSALLTFPPGVVFWSRLNATCCYIFVWLQIALTLEIIIFCLHVCANVATFKEYLRNKSPKSLFHQLSMEKFLLEGSFSSLKIITINVNGTVLTWRRVGRFCSQRAPDSLSTLVWGKSPEVSVRLSVLALEWAWTCRGEKVAGA